MAHETCIKTNVQAPSP